MALQQKIGDSRSSNRPIMVQLTDNKTLSLQETIVAKCIPSPHTVYDHTITNGNSLTFANVSGQPQHFLLFKNKYPVGEALTAKPQGEFRLNNGQVAYHKTHGCYSFVVNYCGQGHSQIFDEQTSVQEVKDYTAFNVTIDQGEVAIHGTTFDSQEEDILYFFIDQTAAELRDWSIEVSYNSELLQVLKPNNEKEKYVDDNDNTLRPTAYYRMSQLYTVYVLEQSDTKLSQKSNSQRKFQVSVGPKLMQPGDALVFCKSSTTQGATTVNVLPITQVSDPSSDQIQIDGGDNRPY